MVITLSPNGSDLINADALEIFIRFNYLRLKEYFNVSDLCTVFTDDYVIDMLITDLTLFDINLSGNEGILSFSEGGQSIRYKNKNDYLSYKAGARRVK